MTFVYSFTVISIMDVVFSQLSLSLSQLFNNNCDNAAANNLAMYVCY